MAVFLLFSFAATKLPSYWLPAVPAASLMIALSTSNSFNRNKSQSIAYFSLAISMLILAIVLSFPNLWLFSISDPEMPNLASEILKSKLYFKSAIEPELQQSNIEIMEQLALENKSYIKSSVMIFLV